MASKLMPLLAVCAAALSGSCASAAQYGQPFRPQLSFSPARNWMNDPNGLVYHDGEYHLFYQYNPNGDTWGDMSWGHAVSTDLLRWEELPLALPVEKNAEGEVTQMFFSGSAVVDHANVSGLGEPGKPAMVALYTAVFPQELVLNDRTFKAGTQSQSLVYSLDRGRSWRQYAANPVIVQPPTPYAAEYRDFRDPKVFWYEPERKWVMALVLPNLHKALFYSSRNLRDWEYMSEFGPMGATGGIWECPDLFELPVDGDPGKRKWVLLMSLNPGGPAGGSGMQYFVGDFDGSSFKSAQDGVQWLDHGADFYAGVTWNGAPDGRRLLVGWMNNWLYGQQVPTSPWRSAQSVPRELALRTIDGQARLVQRPLAEFTRLRSAQLVNVPAQKAEGTVKAAGDVFEIELRLQPGSAVRSGIRVHGQTEIGYDREQGVLYLDRSRAGQGGFHPQFAARHAARVALRDGQLPLRLLVDRGSVTVFAGDGEVVLTDQVFPAGQGMSLFGEGGDARVHDFKVWSIQSIWEKAR